MIQRELPQPTLRSCCKFAGFVTLLGFVLTGTGLAQPRILAIDEGADNIAVFDALDFQFVSNIAVGSHPGFPVRVPALNRLFVPNRDSNSVTVIDLDDGSIISTITHPSLLKPVAATLGSADPEVWIVNQEGGSGSGSITVIDSTTNQVTDVVTDSSFSSPVHAATHSNRLVFIVNSGNNKVTVFNPGTLRIVRGVVDVGTTPVFVAVDSENNAAYVANNGSGSLTRIKTPQLTPFHLSAGGSPRGIIVSRDRIFFTREDRFVSGFDRVSGLGAASIELPVGFSADSISLLGGTQLAAVGDPTLNQIRVVDLLNQVELADAALPIGGFTALGPIFSKGVIEVSDLSLVKTDSIDPVRVDSELTYSLRVTNSGFSTANNLLIEDQIPDDLIVDSADLPGGNCQIGPLGVECQLDSLAAGAEVTAIIRGRFQRAGSFDNRAEVVADEEDPDLGNNEDVETTTVLPSSDVEILLQASPQMAPVGSIFDFDLVVRNFGPSLSPQITLSFVPPATMQLLGADVAPANCVFGTLIRCNLESISPIIQRELHFSFAALEAGTFRASAGVVLAGFDRDAGNNNTSLSVTVTPAEFAADLGISKTTVTPAVNRAEEASFQISVFNLGPDSDPAVEWTDIIPAGFSFVRVSPVVSCQLSGANFSCAIEDFAAGESRDYTITLRAEAGASGLLENTATVVGLGQDTDPSNNQASDSVLILDSGDFNGDGKVDAVDLQLLILEINDGDGDALADILGGSHIGVAQMDLTNDALIDQNDLNLLIDLIFRQ